MAWIRIVISTVATVVAFLIALVAFAYNGYVEDDPSSPAHTLSFAIPWFLATVVLAGLVSGAIASQARRYHWSWWALLLALAMAYWAVAALPLN
jgi:hypothetical protein